MHRIFLGLAVTDGCLLLVGFVLGFPAAAMPRGPGSPWFGLHFLIGLTATTTAQQGGTVDTELFKGLTWRSLGPQRGGRSIAVAGSDARPNEYWFGATGGSWFCESSFFLRSDSIVFIRSSSRRYSPVAVTTAFCPLMEADSPPLAG